MMCLSNTLLPLPLGPMMTKFSPGAIFRLMPLSTSWPSKLLCKSRTCNDTLGVAWPGGFVFGRVSARGGENIQYQYAHDRIDHRLGHAAPDPTRSASRDQPLVAGNDADGQGEHKRFEHAIGHIPRIHHVAQVLKKHVEIHRDLVVGGRDEGRAQPARSEEHTSELQSLRH